MWFRDLPIRAKLTAIILIASIVVMLLMSGSFFVYEFLTFRQTTVRQLATLGEITAANSTAALAFENDNDAREILATLRAERNIVAAGLYNQQGRLFSKFPHDLPDDTFPPAPGAKGYRFEGSRLAGFQPVEQPGNKPLGTLYLQFDTTALIGAWLRVSLAVAAVVMTITLFIAYALSRFLQKQISQPILTLAETARAVSDHGDYSVRAVRTADDELGLLTDAFNRMLEQIQRQNEVLRKNELELERRVTERTAQLQAANKELEAFSYSVSHDLRAPLRHIDGFAGLFANHLKDSLDDKGRHYLSTISASARRMGRLIDDLLVFSRMGRTQMNFAAINTEMLVSAVIRDGLYEKSHPSIVWAIGRLPSVHADAAMLRQVWVNLIENAVKYSSKSPQPRIEIGCTDPKPAGENVMWEFFVRDNGVGFDMSYVDKLFGVFQRLHGPAEFEGTGIGLANVHRIITRHGGKTRAEGSVGQGATFYFSLPSAPHRLRG